MDYPLIIAAKNNNEYIRLKSTSGGVFSALSDTVLDQSGIVFGVRFTDDFYSAKISYAKNAIGLEKFRGSKYIKAAVGDSYIQCADYLNCGKKVLYTGCACHIAGLKNYLRKNDVSDYNLFTMDVICHGACLPELWEKYLKHRESTAGASCVSVFLRDKQKGWHDGCVKIEFKNNLKYIRSTKEDAFFKLFLSNMALAPSCYKCAFKGVKNRVADITTGDFLGAETICPDIDDNKGLSLMLINNHQGMELVKICNKLDVYEISECKKNRAINRNHYLSSCVSITERNDEFLEDLKLMDFENIKHKYMGPQLQKLNNHVLVINFCHRDFPVNYGQTLLGVALYKYIQKLGYQPVIGCYTKRPESMRNRYYTRYFFPDLKTEQSKSFAKTTDFLQKEKVRIVQCFDEIDIYRISEICDRLLVGGDAVWRPLHYDPVFYLNFGDRNKLRVSYSASVVHNDATYEKQYAQMFTMIENNLDYVSTRERTAISLFHEYGLLLEAENVCDPVFLLNLSEWELMEKKVDIKEKYIAVYMFNDSHEYDELIETIVKKFEDKIRVVWIPTGALPDREFIKDGIGIDEFLSFIHHAEAVITNSFHGLAFSVLFKKDFYVLDRKDKSLIGDFRITDFLDILEIRDRVIKSNEDLEKITDIDYKKIEPVLQEYIKKSKSWLAMSLSDSMSKKK